jgi:hypothetical protein
MSSVLAWLLRRRRRRWMCWLWVCCLVLWRGLYRESPVVLSAVSVSAVGFVEGGVLLSSLLKESSFAPAVGGW